MLLLFPLSMCCLNLNVDPKTLRRWLGLAQLSWSAHPGDARLKCLTLSQLQLLAQVHARRLPDPLSAPSAPIGVGLTPAALASREPSREGALLAEVASLQAQVARLQVQMGELRAAQPVGSEPEPLPAVAVASPARPIRRGAALPLIQLGPQGRLRIIDPKQGVLDLRPETAEWFAWLSSLTAFTFESPQGHFSAARLRRHGRWTQGWNARRSLHGRQCSMYLGLGSILTLAHLQEIAATVHARLITP